MWRSLFLAVGIYACLLGVTSIAVEKASLKNNVAVRLQEHTLLGIQRSGTSGRMEVRPPEWAPWSLISVGVVVILYSFTIPKRVRG